MATLTVGIHEAKVHFSEYAHRVEQGDSIVVTRHGKPALRMVPMPQASESEAEVMAKRNAAMDRWLESRKSLAHVKVDIKALIEDGRR